LDEVQFGRYRLIALLGEGGMGKVYRAHDTMMDREVAIKVLPPEIATEPGYEQRFRREAYTAARVSEPHIVPIFEAGEIDGRLYLAMPVIEGTDVHTLLHREGPMKPQRAVHVIDQLASALSAAHAAGLVHRDIKPSNALVTGNDFVYLIDFGIAHAAGATKLTGTGMLIGTMSYMAPERFVAGSADARSDVYALACVLHECLTGATPFPGDSMEQQIAGHLTLDPPRPSAQRGSVPAGFDDVIARGMAKDPEARYQSARDLADAAQSALRAEASAAPRATATVRAPRQAPSKRAPNRPLVRQPQLADRPPAQPASTTPRPQSRAGLIAGIAVGAVLLIAAVAFITLQMSKPRTTPVSASTPTAYASPPAGATSPPTTTPAVNFTYVSILDGRQCRITAEQVNCQPCKPLERINAVAWCDEQPKGYAVDTAGSLDENPAAFGSAPGAQVISAGQTYHELGWTITTDGGWIRFTNDATGHGLAAGGMNRYTF
jgi:serine/threonine protein kinase